MKKIVVPIVSMISILGIYNAIVFAFCKNLNSNFWCGYAFITFAALIVLASFILSAFKDNKAMPSGLPITTLSVYYFVFELALGSLLMYFNINFAIVFVPQLVCLLIFMPVYALGLTKLGKQQPNKVSNPKENGDNK